jgi:hypothetical protein
MEEQNSTATTAPEPSTSYVQSLIGPAGDLGSPEPVETAAQPQPTAAVETGTTPARETTKLATEVAKPGTTLPDVDALIEQFATETGLDASDPNQRKTLKRLADKEIFIRKLQQDNESLKTSTANDKSAPEFVTEFEKELLSEHTSDTAAPPATQEKVVPIDAGKTPAPAAAEPPKYGDIGDAWKTPEDSLTALNEAWTKNDLKAVHQIEVARQLRTFDTQIAPALLAHIGRMFEARLQGFAEKDLGDVVPEFRRNAAEKRVSESREFAIDQLRKAGANDIDELFAVEDGPPIKFNGQEFPNTPLNRLLVKHPEIMQITATHTDLQKAERSTFIARYRLAHQIYKQSKGGVAADTAKALVEAGRTAKNRETADRTRQGINAGSGTSGLGGDKSSKSYVGQLNSLPGEVPLSSLLS